MWGAIIGDIVGSRYEWDRIKTKEFEFFHSACEYTDDSVCTAAVADILLHDLPPASNLQRWCRRHPGRGYGGMFLHWIESAEPAAYGSFGNGAAMRVSPAAFLYRDRTVEAALEAADTVTATTHDHPEGMKGARAVTHAIWLAFRDADPGRIRQTLEEVYGYDLSRSVDQIRPSYRFNETCQETVPEAVTCALESESFEGAVRNAVSLGGDADTLAAIAGPIAEAMHGMPPDFVVTVQARYLQKAPDIVDAMKTMYAAGESSEPRS